MQKTGKRKKRITPAADAPLKTHIIELGNTDCRLEDEVLKNNTSSRAFKKEWDYPSLKLVAYKEGTIEWKNTWNRLSTALSSRCCPTSCM